MVENADHDVRPLDLAQLVNLATAPDSRLHDVEFNTRHVGLSQYDLLLC
jgi:hypothetical protein